MAAYKKKKGSRRAEWLPLAIGAAAALLLTLAAVTVFALRGKETDAPAGGGRETGETLSYQGKEYAYNDHLSNFLFLGIDTQEKVEEKSVSGAGGQADSLFLASYDRMENTLSLLMIPRDTMTDIHVFDFSGNDLGFTKDHISLSYAYGDGKHTSCQLAVEAVENLLGGIPIQGYCSLNIDGIPLLTKELGGVPVTVPDDSLREVDPEFWQGARVILDETNTETFVRYRDVNQSQSAITRMGRQKVFLEAYSDTLQEAYGRDPSVISDLLFAVEPYMVTNLGNDQFLKLAGSYLEKGRGEIYTVPGQGVEGKDFDEYLVDEKALQELVLTLFYQEVS